MSKYSAEIERVHRNEEHPDSPITLLVVSVYGDLPSRSVTTRTRNALLKAAGKVAVLNGVQAFDWSAIDYRVGVNNGEERHTVSFVPGTSGIPAK